MTDPTHYDILRISVDASTEQIKQAFKTRIKEVHTDIGGSKTETIAVNEANRVLGHPSLRADYDAQLRAPADDGHALEEDPNDVVDDWGAEAPIPPRPAAEGEEHRPRPRWHEPPPQPTLDPLPQPAPWPWEPSYQGPPLATALHPWHRVWLAGHGGWVLTARILTCIVATLLLAPLLVSVIAMAIGQTQWDELPQILAAWALICAIILLPTWRRSMGGKFGKLYGAFVVGFIAVPLLIHFGTADTSTSWAVILAIGVTIVLAAEVRHFALTTRRARIV